MAESGQVRTYFDTRAAEFDALYEGGPFARLINRWFRSSLFIRVERTLQECQKSKVQRLLDVGCGSGRVSVPLALGGVEHVTGIDFAPEMLKLATGLAARNGVSSRCMYVHGDFMSYSFPEPFDACVALGVLDYVPDPVAFLRRMRELSTGLVMASVPAPDFPRAPLRKWRYALRDCPVYFYNRSQAEALLRGAGFGSYRVETVPAGFLLIGYEGNSQR